MDLERPAYVSSDMLPLLRCAGSWIFIEVFFFCSSGGSAVTFPHRGFTAVF